MHSAPVDRCDQICRDELPLALLEFDFSPVQTLLSDLQATSASALEECCDRHPGLLADCCAALQTRVVNRVARDLLHLNSNAPMNGCRDLFQNAGEPLFKQLLLNLMSASRFALHGSLQLPEESMEAALHVSCAADADRSWSRVLVAISDRGEQRPARDELLRREKSYRKLYEQFRVLFEGISDCLLIVSSDLKISWANPATATTCHRPVEELVGRNCWHLAAELLLPCDPELIEGCIRSGETQTGIVATRDGRHWGLRIFPIQDETGRFGQVLQLAHDITEKIRLQTETIHTGQLAALGELAAGVAHEINNPVNGIINYAQILINRLPPGNHAEISERILKEGDRIARIVGALLSFARANSEELRPLIVRDVIEEVLTLCGTQLRKDHIILQIHVPEPFPCIRACRQQIQQVLLSMISNARYALNQRYPAEHPAKLLEVTASQTTDGWCRVSVCDHGIGIPEHLREKIFNPFFSTRPPGSGTGLGLSTSHGIIQNHGGRLSIESSVGHYTRIDIDLPLAGQRP